MAIVRSANRGVPSGRGGSSFRISDFIRRTIALQRLLWRFDRAREALWIQKREQRGEAFGIAVVRCR
jgi:hypothetical protein